MNMNYDKDYLIRLREKAIKYKLEGKEYEITSNEKDLRQIEQYISDGSTKVFAHIMEELEDQIIRNLNSSFVKLNFGFSKKSLGIEKYHYIHSWTNQRVEGKSYLSVIEHLCERVGIREKDKYILNTVAGIDYVFFTTLLAREGKYIAAMNLFYAVSLY